MHLPAEHKIPEVDANRRRDPPPILKHGPGLIPNRKAQIQRRVGANRSSAAPSGNERLDSQPLKRCPAQNLKPGNPAQRAGTQSAARIARATDGSAVMSASASGTCWSTANAPAPRSSAVTTRTPAPCTCRVNTNSPRVSPHRPSHPPPILQHSPRVIPDSKAQIQRLVGAYRHPATPASNKRLDSQLLERGPTQNVKPGNPAQRAGSRAPGGSSINGVSHRPRVYRRPEHVGARATIHQLRGDIPDNSDAKVVTTDGKLTRSGEAGAQWSSEASFGASPEATTDAPELHTPGDPTYSPAENASASRRTRRTLPPARAWQSVSDQPRRSNSENSAG